MDRLIAGCGPFGTQYNKPEHLLTLSGRAEARLRKGGIDLVHADPVFGEGPEPDRAIAELKYNELKDLCRLLDIRTVMDVG